MAATFVQIDRDDIESWLDEVRREFSIIKKWSRKGTTAGVYYLHLSDNVAVRVSTTVGSKDEARGVGKASMQAALASLVTHKPLNKKAMGASHAKRTTNWRTTWKKYVKNFVDVYLKSSAFYERIADPEAAERAQQKLLDRIEEIPNWSNNHLLRSFHEQVEQRGSLSDKQMRILDGMKDKAKADDTPLPEDAERVRQRYQDAPRGGPEPRPEQTFRNPNHARIPEATRPQLVERARRLYVEARNRNDRWLMEFLANVGKRLADNTGITEPQLRALEKNLRKYRLASERAKMVERVAREA